MKKSERKVKRQREELPLSTRVEQAVQRGRHVIDLLEAKRDARLVTKMRISTQQAVQERLQAEGELLTMYLKLMVAEDTMRKTPFRWVLRRYLKKAGEEIARVNHTVN